MKSATEGDIRTLTGRQPLFPVAGVMEEASGELVNTRK